MQGGQHTDHTPQQPIRLHVWCRGGLLEFTNVGTAESAMCMLSKADEHLAQQLLSSLLSNGTNSRQQAFSKAGLLTTSTGTSTDDNVRLILRANTSSEQLIDGHNIEQNKKSASGTSNQTFCARWYCSTRKNSHAQARASVAGCQSVEQQEGASQACTCLGRTLVPCKQAANCISSS